MSAPKYPIACPVCRAPANLPCRATTSGRVSDTHLRRIDECYGNPAKGIARAPRPDDA